MSRRRQPKFKTATRARMSPHQRKRVWDKSKGRCWYCGTFMVRGRTFTVDHLTPCSVLRSMRPQDKNTITNLVPCCRKCNSAKGSLTVEQFRQLRTRQNPQVRRVTFWFENKRNYTPNQCSN